MTNPPPEVVSSVQGGHGLAVGVGPTAVCGGCHQPDPDVAPPHQAPEASGRSGAGTTLRGSRWIPTKAPASAMAGGDVGPASGATVPICRPSFIDNPSARQTEKNPRGQFHHGRGSHRYVGYDESKASARKLRTYYAKLLTPEFATIRPLRRGRPRDAPGLESMSPDGWLSGASAGPPSTAARHVGHRAVRLFLLRRVRAGRCAGAHASSTPWARPIMNYGQGAEGLLPAEVLAGYPPLLASSTPRSQAGTDLANHQDPVRIGTATSCHHGQN